jgi:prepilin peptidase CpaA
MSALAVAIHAIIVAVYPLATAWAVVTDVRRLIIPNTACVAIAAAFLPAALLNGLDAQMIAWHYGVAVALLLVGMAVFARRLVGGGDVKLLAAVAVWIGRDDIFTYLVVMALLGGALAMLVLIAARLKRVLPALGRITWLGDGTLSGQPIPYGAAVGVAAILILPKSPALPPSWLAMFPW